MIIVFETFSRPADSLNLFMSPLRMLQLLLCSHKKCIIKFFVVCLLIILVGLFFYSMPVSCMILINLELIYGSAAYREELLQTIVQPCTDLDKV